MIEIYVATLNDHILSNPSSGEAIISLATEEGKKSIELIMSNIILNDKSVSDYKISKLVEI